MGYELYAKKGGYFRSNIWSWVPLWRFVAETCDDILTKEDIEHGESNDGHLVTEDKALNLAERLEAMLLQGKVNKHERIHRAQTKNLPLRECEFCCGSGTLDYTFAVAVVLGPWLGNRQHADGVCSACGGDGRLRDPRSWMSFSEENVREFAAFCSASGGFSIC